jgi:hypothetical protein
VESGLLLHGKPDDLSLRITNNRGSSYSASNPVITFADYRQQAGDRDDRTHHETRVGETAIRLPRAPAGRGFMGKTTITNCSVVENLQAGISVFSTTIASSIVYGNDSAADKVQIDSGRATVTYSDVQGGWEGDGNIDADPCFAAWGHWVNPADPTAALSPTNLAAIWEPGDYHLKSQGWRWDVLQGSWVSDEATSPCIDAGDPAAELLDEPRTAPGDTSGPVINQRVDMGAYGGTKEASLAPLTP